jgi:probable F420-dependent oxidoreductase
MKIERFLNWSSGESIAYEGRSAKQPNWAGIRDQVRDAESLGYDALVIPETTHDAYLAVALAAQEPAKVELVTGITLAFTRSPVSTAYTAWDLQSMSGGRFALGLGTQVKGHITRRFSMPWSAPAQRMKDYVGALRACWRSWQTGEPLDYRSAHYNVSLMPPLFMPPPQSYPAIPVHIAGVQARMLQTVGEVGDGARLHHIVTRKYLDQVAFPNLKLGFEKSGRQSAEWKDFPISGGGFICTAKDSDSLSRKVDKLKSAIAFYGSTRSYRQSFELAGWASTAESLHRLSVEQKWDQMKSLITEEMVYEFAAVGTYDKIAAVIKKRFAGVNRIGLDLEVRDVGRGQLTEIMQDLRRAS